VVEDAAIIRPGDGAELDATVFDLERLHLLGAVCGQAVLEVDAGERCRELSQIGGWRADQAGKLPKAPMGRLDGSLPIRQHQRQPLGIISSGFHSDRRAIHRPGPAPLGPAAHGGEQVRQGQVALVRWPGKPL
jgi:hypothetical protein